MDGVETTAKIERKFDCAPIQPPPLVALLGPSTCMKLVLSLSFMKLVLSQEFKMHSYVSFGRNIEKIQD